MKNYDALIYLFCLILQNSLGQTNLYLSTSGDDFNPGTIDQPLASFDKVLAQARTIRGPVTIYLREGKYYLDQSIVFTLEDSRGPGEEMVIQAYPDEKVVISGAIPLDLTWEDYHGGIQRTRVDKKIIFDQLYVDGLLQHMARYPNYHVENKYYGGTAANVIDSIKISGWNNPTGGYIHALHKHEWGGYHYHIEGKDKNGALMLTGGYQNNRKMGMHDEHRFVENIFEELDTVGEWYFDKAESILYYYPEADLDLADAIIEVPQLNHLFEFLGNEEKPVKNITLKDLTLVHTTRTFMENQEPLLRSDWTIYRGGAIVFEGAESCAVKNCQIHDLGSNAIFFNDYNRSHQISSNHIYNAGASGICFVGDPLAVRSPSFEYHQRVPLAELDKTPGPKTNNFPANCMVYDNLIHHLGITEKQVAGVQISMSQFITVSHNSIYNVPRAGINIGDGTWGGHVIENNDVFNTVLETGDHGSFNSWGRDRYWYPNYDTLSKIVKAYPELILLDAVETTVIRNNRFRCDHGWDIDLDDGSSNYHIYNNLCLNGGLKLREGFYRKVENNIMINNSFHPHVWFENSGDLFIRNIITRPYAPIRLQGWGQEIDYNLFPDIGSLEKAHEFGTDAHSSFGDPKFNNEIHGDFKVSQNSPAIDLGFKNFSMDSFGVVSQNLKKIAAKIPLPDFQPLDPDSPGDLTADWQGITIKNMTTLGEQSASGAREISGVMVLLVNSWSKFNGLIKPGDVILKYNGIDVKNLEDLEASFGMTGIDQSGEVLVFRGQKELLIRF
ncbi:MAG: PDZ domain-containing protein [Saprospiraceae bacterium]|nr:PDZ domain-containing protein [Saprospiraceae bacterium]